METSNKIILTIVIAICLLFSFSNAWAENNINGTVPPKVKSVSGELLIPVTGGINCLESVKANMGTAVFTGCLIVVEKIDDPIQIYTNAPDGFKIIGDTFTVTAESEYPFIEACYSYPPYFQENNANVYRLDIDKMEWIKEENSVINKGMLCVTSIHGVFTLLGKSYR